MSALRFRAMLTDPGNANQERPVQIFGNDRAEIDAWAAKVLQNAVSEDALVQVFESTEKKVGEITKAGTSV